MLGLNFRKIAIWLIPVNVAFDISLSFFERGGTVPMVRAGFMLAYLLYILFRFRKASADYAPLLLFCGYCILNLLFSSDFMVSLNMTLKVLISILSFAVGYNVIITPGLLHRLNHSIVVVLGMLVLNYIVSQSLGIGIASYTESDDFLTGNLEGWDLYTYAILIVPLILAFTKRKSTKRYIIVAMAFVNALLVFISIKRTAILVLVLGLFTNSLLNFKLKRIIKPAIIIAMLGLISYPIIEPLLMKRLDARAERFENGLEEEGRYRESAYVWEEAFSFEDPLESLFGLEAFNSVGNYAGGAFGIRQLHVDYNLIVNTIGFVGLFLYFAMFAGIHRLFRRYYLANRLPQELKRQLLATFYTLFLMQFITSMSGQMYSISFRMIIFLYMGAMIGILKNQVSSKMITPEIA
jgi:O-antigen ligase